MVGEVEKESRRERRETGKDSRDLRERERERERAKCEMEMCARMSVRARSLLYVGLCVQQLKGGPRKKDVKENYGRQGRTD